MSDLNTKKISQVKEYLEAGLALVPISLGSKAPSAEGWNDKKNAITQPGKVEIFEGNVGLAHAYCTPEPTCVIDIDNMELALSWCHDRGVDLKALCNANDAVQIISGRPNRGKLVFKLPTGTRPLQTQQIRDPATKHMILEFRCASANGKTVQDVLPPSIHPDTGRPYEWAGKGSFKNLPTLPQRLLEIWTSGKLKPKTSTSTFAQNAAVTVGEQTVQHLRSALLHMRAENYEEWIRMGMALKCLGDVGRGLWQEWSLTSKMGEPLEVAETWETFKPNTISYASVFAEAQRQGWINPAKNYLQKTPRGDNAWLIPQPLPNELLAVKSLDPSWLPSTIRAGVIDITERLGCPLDYVAIASLVGAGVVIGNTVGILPKEHDDSWEVYPGFWGGIVGYPGAMKTPALQAAFRPLYHLEEQAALKYQVLLTQYQASKTAYEKALANYKAGKASILPIEPIEPTKPRLIVNDVTYQKLGEVLAANPSGILALSDELSGLLQSLDTAGQEAARGFYLSGWGGTGNYTFDRITRGTVILSNYMLCVFGGFQPDRIKGYVNCTTGGNSKNDGLLQRFQLLVWPDTNPAFTFVDRPPNKTAINTMHSAIIKLHSLRELPIPGAIQNTRGVNLLHFTQDAQTVFNQWFVANEKMLRKPALTSALHSHFSKYRSLVPGLALLFHLLEGHQGAVCKDCLEAALYLAKYLKSHTQRVYASVNGFDKAPVRALADKLISGKLKSGFTVRSVYTKEWSSLNDVGKVKAAADVLVELGWLKEEMLETGGRGTISYQVNPNISAALL